MKLKSRKLDFYNLPTEQVAKDLIGDILEINLRNSNKPIQVKIVETEAYLGLEDPACHTFGGKKTPRTASMFLPGGHSYVYFIYGMYHCLNVVTGDESRPEAVLIRALEPVSGEDRMRRLRNPKKRYDLCNGPGKLCLALGIDQKHDGLKLNQKPMRILTPRDKASPKISTSPRIGIGTKHEACFWHLRFFEKDNPWVSKVPSGNPK